MSLSYPKNVEEFKKLITENNKVVIYFTAVWCGPCRMVDPHFDKLVAENPELSFAKVDIDQVPDIPAEVGIRGLPTFLFYKDGKKFDEYVGPDPNVLTEHMQKFKQA